MTDAPSSPADRVDVLFFEVGRETYGTDASQVLRIDRAMDDDLALEALGPLERGTRALVFETSEGERHLKVDGVTGVRPVPAGELRRLPQVVGAPSFTIGLCLEGQRPVLLIDLAETVKAQGRQ